MSYCLNPDCSKRSNPPNSRFCLNCGDPLLLRGHYEAVKPIGRGGFARTYLAIDRERLDTPCTIKQFSPRAKNQASLDKALELFAREALRLRDLGEHPQIPTLLAYFEERGRLYLVQQFIEGPNLLQEFRRKGPFSSARIQQLLRDVLPVLQFVHDRRVVHRDLKPDNIIRRRLDDRLVPIDFGIAKSLAAKPGARGGTRIGTEGYAPPEQLRSGKAYPASDLYSLGATCIFLLTGVPPEELYNPLTDTWPWREQLAQWDDAFADASPALEEAADPARQAHYGPRLPVTRQINEGLGRILDKLLKTHVGDRYPSANQVLADLNQLHAHPVLKARSPFLHPDALRDSRDRARRRMFPEGFPSEPPSLEEDGEARSAIAPSDLPTGNSRGDLA